MRRRTVLAALGGALVWSRFGRSQESAPACTQEQLDRALADIARARSGITSLVGAFTQERTIGLLAAKVRSTGTLTLVRPDRLRWELDPPDAVTYWVTPEGLAYKNASEKGRVGAANSKVTAALADLRALLGGDLGQLRARYDLRGTCTSPIQFEAIPKPDQPAPTVKRIAFTLAPDLVAPQRVTLVETERDRTEIQFGPMTKNVPVDPAKMRFSP
jgi:outer membrane lipoprotein-sorting protein